MWFIYYLEKGSPTYPLLQAQSALWPRTVHSVLAPQGLEAQGSNLKKVKEIVTKFLTYFDKVCLRADIIGASYMVFGAFTFVGPALVGTEGVAAARVQGTRVRNTPGGRNKMWSKGVETLPECVITWCMDLQWILWGTCRLRWIPGMCTPRQFRKRLGCKVQDDIPAWKLGLQHSLMIGSTNSN